MEMTDTASHLSIGEVLSLLKEGFPDVTISKIRFLESQGLVDPERTPSGYRRFYEFDIERLRWILRQQRDHFLPLKVIKAKIEAGDFDDGEAPTQTALFPSATPPLVADEPAVAAPLPQAGSGAEHSHARDSAAWLRELQEGPASRQPASVTSLPVPTSAVPAVRADSDGLSFGSAEVAEVTGVSAVLIETLVEFGLVSTRSVGGELSFDATALAVIRAAAPLLARGVEARHLRSFKIAADREAGFYVHLILPLLKQRNPGARVRASETLESLISEGSELHATLIAAALAQHLE